MKTMLLRLVAAATAIIATVSVAQTLSVSLMAANVVSESADASGDGYLEVIQKVSDHVWVIRQTKPFHVQPIGNVTVIEQSRGLVLIDSGGSPGSGRRIAKLIRSVTPKPVETVVITHWHGDHPFGIAGLRETWPALKIVASEPTKRNLLGKPMERYAKGGPDENKTLSFLNAADRAIKSFADMAADPKLPGWKRDGSAQVVRELTIYKEDGKGLYVATPIQGFARQIRLPDRVVPVEIAYLGRANTDGDAIAWLPKQKILVSGDIVVAPVPFGFDSYPTDWINVLKRLRNYDFKMLVPGHGPLQRDRRYLNKLIALIEDVRRQVYPLAKKQLSLEAVRKQVNFDKEKRGFVGNDPWLGFWFDQSWVDPFVESAWKEAKGQPITQ